MAMKKKKTLFQDSWETLKENKILFIPNVLILVANIILVLVLFLISGLGTTLLNNSYPSLDESFFSFTFLFYFLLYFAIFILVDNYFITMKYGLIKDILLKKKTSLKSGFSFANQHYLTTLGIHALSYLIIFVPLFLLATVFFLLLPISSLVSITLFVPIGLVYLIYIGIRLLYVFPVMTFEKKGAYNSLKKDFHFVKAHAQNTIITWMIVVGVTIFISILRENVIKTSEFLFQQLYVLGILVLVFIFTLEFLVLVWEHVFIFKSYLAAKKGKTKKKAKKRSK